MLPKQSTRFMNAAAPTVGAAPVAVQASRAATLNRIANEHFDLVVVGGGATGLGVAVDAALRGLSVALLEAHDFAKGTSSRATKLVHGGVRYLAQGRIGLVRESLHERTTLLRNAPGLVKPLAFVAPAYRLWEIPFHAAGLAAYDMLAGSAGLGPTRVLSRSKVLEHLPGVRAAGLKGGVEYWDAQFDDARLAVILARAAAARGAAVLNYCPVVELSHANGKITGVTAHDTETGAIVALRARCVVNATGVWTDAIRGLDANSNNRPESPLVRASRGTHLVVDRSFFPSQRALLVPRTADGRVLFAVPWLGKVVLGTTDIAPAALDVEPCPSDQEIDYILRETSHYLQAAPQRRDVRSAWAGLRPLVDPSRGKNGEPPRATTPGRISREHTIEVSPSGLVTVAGGKWTTYRVMAKDVLDTCFSHGLLPGRTACTTQYFELESAVSPAWDAFRLQAGVASEDNDTVLRQAGLSEAMIRFAARHEYARKLEDVLARRSRLLFLDATLAGAVAPVVAGILEAETGVSADLAGFLRLARQYNVAAGEP